MNKVNIESFPERNKKEIEDIKSKQKLLAKLKTETSNLSL